MICCICKFQSRDQPDREISEHVLLGDVPSVICTACLMNWSDRCRPLQFALADAASLLRFEESTGTTDSRREAFDRWERCHHAIREEALRFLLGK